MNLYRPAQRPKRDCRCEECVKDTDDYWREHNRQGYQERQRRRALRRKRIESQDNRPKRRRSASRECRRESSRQRSPIHYRQRRETNTSSEPSHTESTNNRAKRDSNEPEHRPERDTSPVPTSKKRKADDTTEKPSHKRRISLKDIRQVVEKKRRIRRWKKQLKR